MSNKLPADYHMHSHNSGDSVTPMEEMIKSSIEKGLSEICFTEHMDMDFPIFDEVPKDTFTLDTDSYRNEFLTYREKYKDQINIKFGVEIGMQTQVADENTAYSKKYDFDFIIASMHLVDKMDPYYPYLWENADEMAVMDRYFNLTIENLRRFDNFDVLGHLDYIVRYTPSKGQNYSYARYKEAIDEILNIIVKNKKGIEINTKSLYIAGSHPNPHEDILRRYKELGGEILTFGSDAHKPDGVGGAFTKALEIAKSIGFMRYYTFEGRIPTSHEL